MDSSTTLWVICACMVVGAYLPGLVALLMPSQMHSTSFTSAVSAGLLLGAGLCVIVPEGFETLQKAQEQAPGSGNLPVWAAGAALLAGFLLMSTLDAFRPTHAAHEEGCPGHMHHHHPSAGHNHGHTAQPPAGGMQQLGPAAMHKLGLHAPLQSPQQHVVSSAAAPFDVTSLLLHQEPEPRQEQPHQQQHSELPYQNGVLETSAAMQIPAPQQDVTHGPPTVPAVQAVHAVRAMHSPRCSHHHHRTAAGLHVCHHRHLHGHVHLHHVSISRHEAAAQVCNHPPHAFPPSDCLLLPQCSWQPLQPDELCDREAPLSSGTSECSEVPAPASPMQQLVVEDADENQLSQNQGLGVQDWRYHQQHVQTHADAVVLDVNEQHGGLHTPLLMAGHLQHGMQAHSQPSQAFFATPPHIHDPHEHHQCQHRHHQQHPPRSQRQSLQTIAEGRAAHASSSLNYARLSQTKQRDAHQALIGLVIHSSADGLAVGAAGLANNLAVSLTIALSIMVHKLPVAYGLAAFLRAAGQTWHAAHAGLVTFVLAAPCTALLTYYLVGCLTWAANPQVVALCLLASGGTVLHAGAVHVLPSAGTSFRQLFIMSVSCCVPLLISALVGA